MSLAISSCEAVWKEDRTALLIVFLTRQTEPIRAVGPNLINSSSIHDKRATWVFLSGREALGSPSLEADCVDGLAPT